MFGKMASLLEVHGKGGHSVVFLTRKNLLVGAHSSSLYDSDFWKTKEMEQGVKTPNIFLYTVFAFNDIKCSLHQSKTCIQDQTLYSTLSDTAATQETQVDFL